MAAPPPPDRYEAALLLAAAGDALGFRAGLWEYCTAGARIHEELRALGGLSSIELRPPEWPLSDDTVLHLATAEGLSSGLEGDALLQELARRYVAAMGDMEGRKPGPSSILGTSQLRPGEPQGYRIPFNPTGTGCGAAMRSLAIGLRYPRPEELPMLIRVPGVTGSPGGGWSSTSAISADAGGARRRVRALGAGGVGRAQRARRTHGGPGSSAGGGGQLGGAVQPRGAARRGQRLHRNHRRRLLGAALGAEPRPPRDAPPPRVPPAPLRRGASPARAGLGALSSPSAASGTRLCPQ
ncbi:ADP-ribosylhydrolase ARH1-like isoform X3 [Excalfactoria chinensis]|uniref:ADP-ribosylhydrolase ARH1-like isoform X3 n=1 Tax=Excalfactoria chinensis TaxID=46218 RepID=UPI003B3B45AA